MTACCLEFCLPILAAVCNEKAYSTQIAVAFCAAELTGNPVACCSVLQSAKGDYMFKAGQAADDVQRACLMVNQQAATAAAGFDNSATAATLYTPHLNNSGDEGSTAVGSRFEQQPKAPGMTAGAPAAATSADGAATASVSSGGAGQQQQQQQQQGDELARLSRASGTPHGASQADMAGAALNRQPSKANIQQQQQQAPHAVPAGIPSSRALNGTPDAQSGPDAKLQQVPGWQQAKKISKPKGLFACCFAGDAASDGEEEAVHAEPTAVAARSMPSATTAAPREAASTEGGQQAACADSINSAAAAAAALRPVGVGTEYALLSGTAGDLQAVPPYPVQAEAAAALSADQEGGPLPDVYRSSEVWGVAKPEGLQPKACLGAGDSQAGQQKELCGVAGKSLGCINDGVEDGFTIKAHHFVVSHLLQQPWLNPRPSTPGCI